MRSQRIVVWHRFLCTIAALNVTLWILSAVAVRQAAAPLHADTRTALYVQLLLSGAYVFGCAFRSVLPVYDIPRLVLVDSRLSSVIVGRSVASIAELCFAAQWALLLHRLVPSGHGSAGQAVSWAIVPLIALAEACSWYSVLRTTQGGHIVENSLWGLSAGLVVVSVLMIAPQAPAGLYPLVLAWCAGGAAYVLFIVCVDVPMYWSRWRADRRRGRHYLSLAAGVADAWQRRVVSCRWEDWKSEVPWMSLYFTVGVWSSVSLVYASAALGAHRR